MNILENFNFSIDMDNQLISTTKRAPFISHKPKYQCSEVQAIADLHKYAAMLYQKENTK